MPVQVTNKLINWASVIDEQTLQQALRASRLPIIHGHVALMPDAHWGMGATIGSVIPTDGAIIPSAVGVDIGCGMGAIRTSLTADMLPDTLDGFLKHLRHVVPAGVGVGHNMMESADHTKAGELDRQLDWAEFIQQFGWPRTELTDKQKRTAAEQFGSLGSGNHFFEICLDEQDRVWVMLHSGSRGIGNQLAQVHIKLAKGMEFAHPMEDPDLAYFQQGTIEFENYVMDMLWSQKYAYWNRQQMMMRGTKAFLRHVTVGTIEEVVNCHHNYATQEMHDGTQVWVTRKGAIHAAEGELGIIPGSMGAKSYIVRGLGNPASWLSCSHGAGRAMSRGKAKREIPLEDFRKAMEGRIWQERDAQALLDEAPGAYKDIDVVMNDQRDLVEIVHTLRGVLNYKGL